MTSDLKDNALQYHRNAPPGKLAVVATKPMENQRDLALAYSPGVAYACQAIVENPAAAREVTARGNLVAVITNGTAVLGLGAIGALASKPVMEGKAVLFKKFAGIDSIDIEIEERDPSRFVDVVAAMEPTFGAINLEDIKAPECFEIEAKLRERMAIPVFHDDQHGTAICVAAAIQNALRVTGKLLADIKLVCSGAGAAAIACLDLLVSMGLPTGNVWVSDIGGVIHTGRTDPLSERQMRYAQATDARSLTDVIGGADVFLGLSAPNVLKPEFCARMAEKPIIMALANPDPEITPAAARAVRPDAIIATGRSDYPNQVNNVLCFPFIFRGALDCGATTINEAMKIAAVNAIADLALAEPNEAVRRAYASEELRFGPDFLIPKPFDPRLLTQIPPAVAQAAMNSGVATQPLTDMEAYRQRLSQSVVRTGLTMRSVMASAKSLPKRVVFAEGEEDRVLMAVQVLADEQICVPTVIGRAEVIDAAIKRLGLRIEAGRQFALWEQGERAPNLDQYAETYHRLMERKGETPVSARGYVQINPTVTAAVMVRCGDADAMVCGTRGRYVRHLGVVQDLIGLRDGVSAAAALSGVVLSGGTYFITDTHVNEYPSAAQIAQQTVLAAEYLSHFGITPKVALVSHSNFGSRSDPSARKMQDALQQIVTLAPELEVEGEMHADMAFNAEARARLFPNSRLSGRANLLVMPNIDAANIAHNLGRAIGDGPSIGPVLLGVKRPAHIVTNVISVRGLVNIAALAVVDAQYHAKASA